jgi:TonB family protein
MAGQAIRAPMDETLVYRKSGLGVAQLAAVHGRALSRPERHVLILLDGRRTIGELSGLLGSDAVQRLVPELEAKGFAKRVDPTLAAEWSGAVTQLYVGVPARAPSRPRPGRSSDGHPLAWIALATLLAVGSSYWATHRYRSHADAWGLDRTLALVAPTDAYGAPTSTDAVDATQPPRPAPVTIRPISRLPEVRALESAATASPVRAAPHAAARDHRAVVRTELRDASPDHATVSALQSPPVGGSTSTSALKVDTVDATIAPPLPLQGATVADRSATPSDSPAPAPIAAPAPVVAADPPPSSPVVVAVAPPPPQPASDPIGLRPLRHDPPRFPERALRDGIVQSQVRARLWVTPEGKVDQVDIIEATPRGLFDDEVRRALSLWTFQAPGHPTEQVVDLSLKP